MLSAWLPALHVLGSPVRLTPGGSHASRDWGVLVLQHEVAVLLAAWLLSHVRHHLSAGSASLGAVYSFVDNSPLKACDNRLEDPSLRIQMFLGVSLSQPFLEKERLVLLRVLLKNVGVALGGTPQVLHALGRWHAGGCAVCLAARAGVGGSPPWRGAQETSGI